MRILPAAMAWLLALGVAGIARAGEVTLFEFGSFQGRSLTATDTISNFSGVGFNDRAASAVIGGGTWELCSDANFRGRCVTLNPGRYPDLTSMGLDRNISSVRELGGAPVYGGGGEAAWGGGGNRGRFTLYDGFGFAGQPFASDVTQPNLHDQDYNDRARSMIVLHGQWEVCTDAYYRGTCETFGPGRYENLGRLAGQVSSLRLVAATPVAPPPVVPSPQRFSRAILYEGPNFSGRSFVIENEVVANLSGTGFNDRAASLVVEDGYWIFCSDANFYGECRTFGPGEYRSLPWDIDRKISSGRRVHAQYPYSQNPSWSR
jgi:hypothetical protein